MTSGNDSAPESAQDHRPAGAGAAAPAGTAAASADSTAPTSSAATTASAAALTDSAEARGRVEPFVSPALRTAAAWSWRALIVVAAVAALWWLLAQVKIVVLPVLIALLIGALLSPLARFLVSHRWPRSLATIATVLGFILVVLGLLALVGQQLYSGFSDLSDRVMAGFQAISSWLQSSPFGIESSQISQYIDQGLEKATSFLEERSGQLFSGVAGAASSVTDFFAGMFLVLFSTIFFVYDGQKIFHWFIGMLPVPAREKTQGAALRGWQSLVQYVRVQILVAAVDALGIGLGAFILQVPLVVPLTVLVFMGSFIPIVGAILTGAVAVLVALVSQGPITALIMLGVVLAVQQIEGHVLQPFIMGKAVSVHPLAVVLGVTGGGFLFGIPGALFAVPLMAVANTTVLYLHGRDILAEAQADAERKKQEKAERKRAKASA